MVVHLRGWLAGLCYEIGNMFYRWADGLVGEDAQEDPYPPAPEYDSPEVQAAAQRQAMEADEEIDWPSLQALGGGRYDVRQIWQEFRAFGLYDLHPEPDLVLRVTDIEGYQVALIETRRLQDERLLCFGAYYKDRFISFTP